MKKEVLQYGQKHGIISGLIIALLYFAFYFINKALMANFMVGFIILLFMIIYPIVITVRYKKAQGGYLSLKDGFMVMFMTALVRSLINTVATLILFFVIDTELASYIQEKTISNTVEMMTSFGAADADIEKAVSDMQQRPDAYSIGSQIKGFIFGLVIAAVFSILVALIIRKDAPPFTESGTEQ